MAQRKEPNTSLDYFPTPLWATRALCEHVIDISGERVWEPACGAGHMARPLKEYAARVYTSDVHDYSDRFPEQERVTDFLWPGSESPAIAAQGVDRIITNPPFRLAEQFITRGLALAHVGVAMFVRLAFVESEARYTKLFRDRPPQIIAQFVERVPIFRGRVRKGGRSATAYCWLVWDTVPSSERTDFVWIPPCRRRLEKPGDYE